MANPNHPHSDSDPLDPPNEHDHTYELTTPSEDGLQPSSDADEGSDPGESSRTFISDEFEPQDADSQTVQSDEFEAAGEESRTFISDEFEPQSAADSQTIQSDDFEDGGEESRTFISDEFEPQSADSQTIQSDEFDGGGEESRTFISDEFEPQSAADSQTIQSDEFDDEGRPDATLGSSPEIDKTFVSEEFGDPPWVDTGAATIHVDVDQTNEDSRTLVSDSFGDGPEGLMAQSNINQSINPKSMDSADRKHWESVIRGALGSQAMPRQSKSRKRDSSLVGVGSNLNIQTRTLVEGQPVPGLPVDFTIETKLGEGGMGAVYLANQTSLNRNVALKVIKPISDKESKRLKQSNRLQTVRQHREGQFLSEAVVTGDLEHPNIVPIYDVAATQDGTVFYSMKCVSGTPWSKAIKKRSLHENVDILMKVCDALAFAHSRGVVHRDLKPENVMLGEFGVVLVMDWGLALVTDHFSKHASVKRASSLGGSPAYMAPELATGPLDRIGPAADIYLIGAMLYEIITGRPPHSGSNVSQCLRAAATNKIDLQDKYQGELMDIALKAMATKMEDRYPTVQGFQEAVRGYLSHAESIGLAAKAKADLRSAEDTQQYSDYARAMFGFEQALDLWEGNEPARQGLSQAQLAYAEHALNKQDYELGLSLLDETDPAHTPIVTRLQKAQQEQENRKHRLAWMKRVAAALLAVIFIGGSGALAVINEQKREAVTLKDDAVKARDEAVKSEQAAIASEKQAKEARDTALLAKEAEEKAKEQAIALKVQAEKSAEAEKVARLAADEAKMKAVEAAEKERLAKEAEAKLKIEAIALQKKAEESAEAEKKAKDAAVLAQKKAEEAAEAETKAKLAAVAAKEQETKAKEEAVTLRVKAEAAAKAETKAKEAALLAKAQETKAKDAAIAAEKEAVAERKKAEAAALAEMKAKELETKAKEEAILAQKAEEKAKLEAVEQRKKAEAAAVAEMKAKELETKAKNAAVVAQQAAEKARAEAVVARDAETKAKEVAIAAERQAQYEAYVAKIGLAKARIDQNEFDGARELLQQLKQDPETAGLCGWEWNRLMHQASQSTSNVSAEEPARDVSFSETGRTAVSVADGGRIDLLDVAEDGSMTARPEPRIVLAAEATTSAVSESRQSIATGDAEGTIRLLSMKDGQESKQLVGHTGEVTRVRFLSDGRLISSSLDKSVRLWDVDAGTQLAIAWHIAPVQNVAFSDGDSPVVAAAVADARSGRAVVWQVVRTDDKTEFKAIGDFIEHGAPVHSVAVSRDGRHIASGDGAGHVYLWNRNGVAPLDYGSAIDAALDRINGKTPANGVAASTDVQFTSLTDETHPLGTLTLVADTDAMAHREAVRALDFSADGSRLVSAADDFTIKVWDGSSGAQLETLRGHGGWVRSVGFSPVDSDVVLSAGYDRSVKSWRLSHYSEAVVVNTAAESPQVGNGSPEVQAHDDEIWSAHFSHSGRRIVTTSRDRSAKLWTVVTEGPLTRVQGPLVLTDNESPQGPRPLVEGHRYVALAFRASQDGRTLLIGGVDGTIRLFDVRRGTETGVLHGCGLNTNFAVSADGRLVLTASSEAGVSAQLWELGRDGSIPAQPLLKLTGHEHPVTAFAISPDGGRLYTGDQRGVGRLWNAATGETIGETLTYHGGLRINEAAFLADGRLVTGSDDLTVVLYDPAQSKVEQQIQQPGFVTMLSLHPDSRRVLAVSERSDGETRKTVTSLVISDLTTGIAATVLESTADGDHTQIRSARFSVDGSRIVSVHGGYEAPESFLRLWQLGLSGSPQLVRTLRIPKLLPAPEVALLLPDQANELVTLHDAAAYQWSLQDLEHHQSYRSHGAVTDAGFSADGRFVATCSESVKIWDAETGKPLFKLESPHDGAVLSVQFSPRRDSYEFATAGADGLAKLWKWRPDQQDVEEVRTLDADDPAGAIVRDAVYSPDGARLLTLGDHGVVRLWDVASGRSLAALTDPDAPGVEYLSGAFSSDGTMVLLGATDKRARLWSIDAEQLAADSNPPRAVMLGHADRIDSVAFLPSQPGDPAIRVLTASRDRSARVWDAATGREVISLRKHSLGLTAVDATTLGDNGGTLVLTAGLDGQLILWPSGG